MKKLVAPSALRDMTEKIHRRHRFKIGGVEARREDCVLDRILDGYSAAFGHGGGRDHQLRFTILPM